MFRPAQVLQGRNYLTCPSTVAAAADGIAGIGLACSPWETIAGPRELEAAILSNTQTCPRLNCERLHGNINPPLSSYAG